MKFFKSLLAATLIAGWAVVAAADIVVNNTETILAGDITQLTVDALTGQVTITTSVPYTITRDGGGGGGGPTVVINSFTASATSVNVGSAITLSWITTDADQCTPLNGFGNWTGQNIGLPNGSSSAITMTQQGSFTFTLQCSNDTPTTRSRSVTVNVTDPGVDCGSVTLTDGAIIDWDDAFGDTWPNPRFWEDVVTIPKRGYIAIKFNTRNVTQDGGFATIEHTSSPFARLGSISRCPGDFANALPEDNIVDCTQLWGQGGGVNWSTEGAAAANHECKLDRVTDYYLNVTFTDGVNPNSTTCTNITCKTWLRIWK